MTSAAAWIRNSGARTLTAIICSKPSGVAVHTLSRHVAAATLTTPWTTPNCLSAAAITARGAAGSAMSASTNDRRRAEVGELLGQRLASVDAAPGDHQTRRAVGDDLPGDRLAETLRAAADDDDLAVELSPSCSDPLLL